MSGHKLNLRAVFYFTAEMFRRHMDIHDWVVQYKAADGTSAHLSKSFSIFSPALFFCDLIFIPPIPAALVPSALLSLSLCSPADYLQQPAEFTNGCDGSLSN